jgi:predicted nucleic acid-binding protein
VKLVDANALTALIDSARTEQYARMRELAAQALANGDRLVVPEAVLVETAWVLRRAYGLTGAATAATLRELLSTPPMTAWDHEVAVSALELMESRPSLSITDCLLAARAARLGAEVVTFDARLALEIEATRSGGRRVSGGRMIGKAAGRKRDELP